VEVPVELSPSFFSQRLGRETKRGCSKFPPIDLVVSQGKECFLWLSAGKNVRASTEVGTYASCRQVEELFDG